MTVNLSGRLFSFYPDGRTGTPVRRGRSEAHQKSADHVFYTGAGSAGLTTEQWNDLARRVDIGTKRKADLYDIRERLKFNGLVREYGERWNVA